MNSNQFFAKEVLMHQVVFIEGKYTIVTIFKNFNNKDVILQFYMPLLSRKYKIIINKNKKLLILQELENNPEILEYLIKNKKLDINQLFEKIIINYKKIFLNNISIKTQYITGDIARIGKFGAILQESIMSKPICFKDEFYQLDIQIINVDKYGNKFRHLSKESNVNFGFTVHSYQMLGTFTIKVKIQEFVQCRLLEDKSFYNLSDFKKLSRNVEQKFEQFWKFFLKKNSPFLASTLISHKKYKLSLISKFRDEIKYDKRKGIKYPFVLIQRIFSIKPRILCTILLQQKDLFKVSMYFQERRVQKDFYYTKEKIEMIFQSIGIYLNNHQFQKAGIRIFQLCKQQNLLKKLDSFNQ